MAIDPLALLRECDETQIGASLPSPLNARLDALIELATHAGEKTTRKELVAALILSASADGEALAAALKTYRRAHVRDAMVKGVDRERFLKPTERRPGPRPRRSQS